MATEHFKATEFACKDGCGFGLKDGDVDPGLEELLERTRLVLDRPVILKSVCRCPRHNTEVGGVVDSAHIRGTAADIAAPLARQRWEVIVGVVVAALWIAGALKISPWVAMQRLRAGLRGIGIGRSFVHIDLDLKLDSEGKRPSAWGYNAGE